LLRVAEWIFVNNQILLFQYLKNYLCSRKSLTVKEATEHSNLVGSLNYLTLSHLDLSFSINKVYQFLYARTSLHWTLVKRILQFVKGTLDMGLTGSQGSFLVSAFFDANWVGCTNGKHSTRGVILYLG
jgi:hypothetical protein